MGTHTPGPWLLMLGMDHSINGATIVTDGGLRVATIPRKADRPYDQKEADAHLIAAAPDLLAALMAILDDAIGAVHEPLWIVRREFIDAARAALAKAEGRA